MHRVIAGDEQRVPIRVWARRLSSETEDQLTWLARQPYVVEFIAAMADAHLAEGVAVGTVFATERTLVPAALGGDLGCGMSAVKLEGDTHRLDHAELQTVVRELDRAIPTGRATHTGRGLAVPETLLSEPLSTHKLEHMREALARRHLGTLGAGNHFLELDRDVHGCLWLLVHSGSRGPGAAIAQHHVNAANEGVPGQRLRGLDATTEAGMSYWRDQVWSLDFARANRAALAARAIEVLSELLPTGLTPGDELDAHHNFIARERWFGRDLWIHRKGAVAAPYGARLLVPGSMGTASYIVEGVGCEDSFGSCSHGAGRVMTRREARASIRATALTTKMRHIAFPDWLARDLVEEAPSAYRDIVEVLEDQEDLVMRRVRLQPIAVLKG